MINESKSDEGPRPQSRGEIETLNLILLASENINRYDQFDCQFHIRISCHCSTIYVKIGKSQERTLVIN